jgi:hypothetical protein
VSRERPLVGHWLAALGGVALIASLFMDWYGDDDSAASGWESFSVTDLVLLAAGLLAISLPIVGLTQRTPAIPIALDSIAALVGLMALALVIFRVLNLPGADLEREIGVWIALAAATGLVLGAFLGMRDEDMGPAEDRWRPGEESPVPTTPVPEPKRQSGE